MTLDVAVHYPQTVHVVEHTCAVKSDFYFHLIRDVLVTLHMKQSEQTIVDQFVNDDDVRNRGTASHEQGNVRMAKNALHHDLVLNFSE